MASTNMPNGNGNGVAPAGQKREGDGRTPSGVYGFDFMFGVNADPGATARSMGEVFLCPECRQPVDLRKRYVVTNRAAARTKHNRVFAHVNCVKSSEKPNAIHILRRVRPA